MKRKEPKYKYENALLLDDSELDNFINKKVIESAYFAKNIYINSSGKSAIEFLQNIMEMKDFSDIVFPDIIFIDLNMPIINGFQFIELLKNATINKDKKCKLVVLTSSMHPDDKRRIFELAENITFLHKPLTEEMLSTL
jgi:CheY-like chemotaxis protein